MEMDMMINTWIKASYGEGGTFIDSRTTPDCMPSHLLDEKNVRMLTSHKVFSEAELKSRRLRITLDKLL